MLASRAGGGRTTVLLGTRADARDGVRPAEVSRGRDDVRRRREAAKAGLQVLQRAESGRQVASCIANSGRMQLLIRERTVPGRSDATALTRGPDGCIRGGVDHYVHGLHQRLRIQVGRGWSRLWPHLGDAAAFVDVPGPNVRAVYDAVDGGHGFQEALGDDVEGCVAVCEAEQVAAVEGGEFVGAVADALVLRQQCPAASAAFGDPFGIADLLGVVGIEVGDEVDGVSSLDALSSSAQ